jgi:hypothetical protein
MEDSADSHQSPSTSESRAPKRQARLDFSLIQQRIAPKKRDQDVIEALDGLRSSVRVIQRYFVVTSTGKSDAK